MTNYDGSLQGINALKSGVKIGDTTIFTGSTITATSVIPNRIGDIYINYTSGKMYIAGAVAATTDWNLVTSA